MVASTPHDTSDIGISLDELTDVYIDSSLSPGDVLTYDSSGWHNEPASGGSSAGRHAEWISAGAMLPGAASGCQVLSNIASASGQPDILTLNFDPSLQEYAQFSIRMPKSWNEGTVTFVPVWSHAATTTNFGVVWTLHGTLSDDDTILANFGTAQTTPTPGAPPTTSTWDRSPARSRLPAARRHRIWSASASAGERGTARTPWPLMPGCTA